LDTVSQSVSHTATRHHRKARNPQYLEAGRCRRAPRRPPPPRRRRQRRTSACRSASGARAAAWRSGARWGTGTRTRGTERPPLRLRLPLLRAKPPHHAVTSHEHQERNGKKKKVNTSPQCRRGGDTYRACFRLRSCGRSPWRDDGRLRRLQRRRKREASGGGLVGCPSARPLALRSGSVCREDDEGEGEGRRPHAEDNDNGAYHNCGVGPTTGSLAHTSSTRYGGRVEPGGGGLGPCPWARQQTRVSPSLSLSLPCGGSRPGESASWPSAAASTGRGWPVVDVERTERGGAHMVGKARGSFAPPSR
jgi:hypothetical protein